MYATETGYRFINTMGQWFSIVGLNDKMAAEDAAEHTRQGRPFGRINMRRLENTYGVKVSFDGHRDEIDQLISDLMEDNGY